MNFQNIRADFTSQCSEREMEMQEATNERLLENELNVQLQRNSTQRYGCFCCYFFVHRFVFAYELLGYFS